MNTQLSLYGETVTISKTETLGDTTLSYWHSQNSPLCGLTIKTSKGSKHLILSQS